MEPREEIQRKFDVMGEQFQNIPLLRRLFQDAILQNAVADMVENDGWTKFETLRPLNNVPLQVSDGENVAVAKYKGGVFTNFWPSGLTVVYWKPWPIGPALLP